MTAADEGPGIRRLPPFSTPARRARMHTYAVVGIAASVFYLGHTLTNGFYLGRALALVPGLLWLGYYAMLAVWARK